MIGTREIGISDPIIYCGRLWYIGKQCARHLFDIGNKCSRIYIRELHYKSAELTFVKHG